MTFEEAKEEALRLLQPFKPDHPRIKLFIGFDVEPAIWADCNHYERAEDALRQAEFEDHQEDKYGRRDNQF